MPLIDIISPLPGTFYRSPSPDAKPFVTEGSRVKAGDVIGLVEVMKQFSEITAESDGVVVKLPVANGDSVEPGQTLVVMEAV